jgi:hypothetical protein
VDGLGIFSEGEEREFSEAEVNNFLWMAGVRVPWDGTPEGVEFTLVVGD